MADFLASSLFDIGWKIICTIIGIMLLRRIYESAMDSLKRPGNKLLNVMDEIIVGSIVLVIVAAVLIQPFSTIFEFVIRIATWAYETFLVPLFALFGLDISL